MINIKQILDSYNIDYKESGENISKGWIGICCPFCSDDKNYHLGINQQYQYWTCWRNSTHSGKGYFKLLKKLLNLSNEQINLLCNEEKLLIEDEFNKIISRLKNTNTLIKKKEIEKLSLYDDFVPITNNNWTKRFWEYLLQRGFDDPARVITENKLLCCWSGKYTQRVILPIYMNGELMTWTSRTIREDGTLRYLDHPVEESILSVKSTLFAYDYIITGGNVLFITEGPFDAMKLNYLLPFINKATCIFTKNITNPQKILIYKLAKKYKKLIFMLDKNEESQMLVYLNQLDFIPKLNFLMFPFTDIKDPGDLTKEHCNKLLSKI